jgi:hypothetical protein
MFIHSSDPQGTGDEEIDVDRNENVCVCSTSLRGQQIRGVFWNRKIPAVYSGLFSFLEVCFRESFAFDVTARPKLAR